MAVALFREKIQQKLIEVLHICVDISQSRLLQTILRQNVKWQFHTTLVSIDLQ